MIIEGRRAVSPWPRPLGRIAAATALVAAGWFAIVVALTAPLLVAPFFHPHYLVALLIPGAFLANRGRPWAVALPLLGWLPGPVLPLVAALAIVAPLLAQRDDGGSGNVAVGSIRQR